MAIRKALGKRQARHTSRTAHQSVPHTAIHVVKKHVFQVRRSKEEVKLVCTGSARIKAFRYQRHVSLSHILQGHSEHFQ